MDIENVAGIIEVLNNHYEKHKDKAKQSKKSDKIFYSQGSTVSISASASNISEIYETLRKSGNEEAMQAFRDTMVKFAQEGEGEDFVHFVHTMEDVSKSSPQLLDRIFLTVADIEERSLEEGVNLDAIEWLSNIGYLKISEIENYLDTTEHILSFEDKQMGEAFQDFVQTTGTLVKGEKSDHKQLSTYFQQTQQQNDGKQFVSYNKEFRDSIDK